MKLQFIVYIFYVVCSFGAINSKLFPIEIKYPLLVTILIKLIIAKIIQMNISIEDLESGLATCRIITI